MTGASGDDCAHMVLAGGRSVEGNRSKSGKVATSVKKPAKKSAKKPAKAKVKTRSKSRSKRG